MPDLEDLVQNARILPFAKKAEIILFYKETDLHKCLKELFSNMEKEYLVEITHGISELGKDLK